MAKTQASAEPRRSLLEVAKAAGCETGTILDVSALRDAGVPITKSKLDTLIDNIKTGAIK